MAFSGFGFCCCTSIEDCSVSAVDFTDGTFGELPNTGAEPWTASHAEHPGELTFPGDEIGDTSGELLWTVPVEDQQITTTYRVAADVVSPAFTDSDGGGVTIAGTDWQAWWGLEGGVLFLRYFDGTDTQEKSTGANIAPEIRLTLTAKAAFVNNCPGWTTITGVSDAGHELSMTVRRNIQVSAFPAEIEMGVFVPPYEQDAGPNPWESCLPTGATCYTGREISVTGIVVNPQGPAVCVGTTEEMAWSTSELFCGGTSLDTLLGLDSAAGYFVSEIPFDSPMGETPAGKILLWCDGGGLHIAALGPDNCLLDFQTFTEVDFTAHPFYWLLNWNYPVDSCVSSGGNSIDRYQLEFNGTIVGCPTQDRTFDNVAMTACAGLDPSECVPVDGGVGCHCEGQPLPPVARAVGTFFGHAFEMELIYRPETCNYWGVAPIVYGEDEDIDCHTTSWPHEAVGILLAPGQDARMDAIAGLCGAPLFMTAGDTTVACSPVGSYTVNLDWHDPSAAGLAAFEVTA